MVLVLQLTGKLPKRPHCWNNKGIENSSSLNIQMCLKSRKKGPPLHHFHALTLFQHALDGLFEGMVPLRPRVFHA